MIIRFVCIDPRPRRGESDVRVYQVPERSRELELLQELCDAAGIEHETLVPSPRRRKEDRK